MKLTVVTVPSPIKVDHPDHTSKLQFDRVEDFAEALARSSGAPVPVVECPLEDVSTGFIVIFRIHPDEELSIPPELGPRIVLVNVSRGLIRQAMEKHRLAGAIDELRYFKWRTAHGRDAIGGLLARRDVAERIGATEVLSPYATEHYAAYSHPHCDSLPELVVFYLAALE